MGKAVPIFDVVSDDISAESILNSLATVIITVDGNATIVHVNNAGEQFFKSSAANIIGNSLRDYLQSVSPNIRIARGKTSTFAADRAGICRRELRDIPPEYAHLSCVGFGGAISFGPASFCGFWARGVLLSANGNL